MKKCPNLHASSENKPFSFVNKDDANMVYIGNVEEIPKDATLVRYTGNCMTKGCANWESGQCSLPGKFLNLIQENIRSNQEKCQIKHECRWYAQEGEKICLKCPLVKREVLYY